MPVEVAALVSCDFLYLAVFLSNSEGSCLPGGLISLTDLRRVLIFEFVPLFMSSTSKLLT